MSRETPGMYEIDVCLECDEPTAGCKCDPADWVDEVGQQQEPPSERVRVIYLEPA